MPEPNPVSRMSLTSGLIVAVGTVAAVLAVVRLSVREPTRRSSKDKFQYRLPAAAKAVAPTLYREQQPLALSLGHPTALAVGPDNELYVGGDRELLRLDTGGTTVARAAVGADATCLAVDERGRVYVGLFDHLDVYSEKLRRLASWRDFGPRARLTSVTAAHGRVFVADAGNRVVLHFDETGRLRGRIGAGGKDAGEGRFVVPSPYFDVALGTDGLLWVVNPGRTRVEAYTLAGSFELAWGKPSVRPEGFSGCCNPAHFAVDPTGGFVTSEKGLVRVKHYDASGVFEGMVAGPEELTGAPPGRGRTRPLEVAVDATGRIFALDALRRQVRLFVRTKAR